jgi:1-acyl-sn-glycerol-3-phosphate acyltransferase
MRRAWRRGFRLGRLAIHLAAGAALVKVVYPIARHELRLAIRAWWCRKALRVLGVQLHIVGNVPRDCHLIAANHISWLDIFVIGAVLPCWFVAKAETRSWPFAGWMAQANRTLFLRRASARAAYRMNAEIRARLGSRQSVVIFPEGTTTEGTGVLDFYPALFQPAIDTGRPVLPLAICYRDDTARTATAVAYVDDDPLWKSLCAVLDAPRTQARLVLDRALARPGAKRRELAATACRAIRQTRLR